MEWSIFYQANNNIGCPSKICQIKNLERMRVVVEDSKYLLKKDVIFKTSNYTTDGYSSNNILALSLLSLKHTLTSYKIVQFSDLLNPKIFDLTRSESKSYFKIRIRRN